MVYTQVAPMIGPMAYAFALTIPIVLIARSVLAGTKYSPILIVVVFGLFMGFALRHTGMVQPGLKEFPFVVMTANVTIIALIASFFAGGQELYRILRGIEAKPDEQVVASSEELVLGTTSTQFVFIIRAFFLMLGIQGLYRTIAGAPAGDVLANVYPLIGYVGIILSLILIDPKAVVKDKRLYIKKGFLEIVLCLVILLVSAYITKFVKPTIALPQIFFAMMVSASLGAIMHNWQFGPTLRSLLFAGIPVVLAANFLVGGTLIADAFAIEGMNSVMAYGFFGQVFWMFGGMSLLIFLGKANHVRNLAPGMAGSLSHTGLTGACTAGDMGDKAASRAPIMINVPFFGHVFVFSILAMSAQQGEMAYFWGGLVALVGIALTAWSFVLLRKANGSDAAEVKGLLFFCFGWQLTAVFGGLMLLCLGGMPINDAAMAKSAGISHFGLFAAVQEGMFGTRSATLIPFIFAMPFLVHPLVFGMFGKAMENGGKMPEKVVYALGATGFVAVVLAAFMIN
ncbi:hypothetical protein [Desulfobotulus sp.]|jgi:hypothetical protein|uniref:hypothetical protein n=1 Tax=Desulfobotulus sp. TaxID=1940337 RepID=UPI002A35AD27|nr:hypothetical protein [Desulfobotulus sp.]MDY0164504.1 hypothetical protein [Desulfobotulus sp.]